MTGFEFKKRRAFPLITGIVVAAENEAAVLEVCVRPRFGVVGHRHAHVRQLWLTKRCSVRIGVLGCRGRGREEEKNEATRASH